MDDLCSVDKEGMREEREGNENRVGETGLNSLHGRTAAQKDHWTVLIGLRKNERVGNRQ